MIENYWVGFAGKAVFGRRRSEVRHTSKAKLPNCKPATVPKHDSEGRTLYASQTSVDLHCCGATHVHAFRNRCPCDNDRRFSDVRFSRRGNIDSATED